MAGNPQLIPTPEQDEAWLRHALALALRAESEDEVPVGAVLVRDGQCVGEGWNQPIRRHDPTAHAEILALRAGAKALGNYRLPGCTLYVTLEPCPMCVGAMLHARVARLVFGAHDPKSGAAGGCFELLADVRHTHKIQARGGVLAELCGGHLRRFFRRKRV